MSPGHLTTVVRRKTGRTVLEWIAERRMAEARRLLVEIPTGFGDMQRRDPDLALAWRMTTRRIFQTYFSRGYKAVDFFLSREAGRGHYLLAT